MSVDRDVAAFDRRGASYERGWLATWHGQVVARSAEIATAAAPDARRVLDIGCGTGALLRVLADRLPSAVDLLGIDPAPGMIAAGRAVEGLDPRIQLGEAAAERMPHPDAAFDLVISTMSFDHWADQRAGILEAARVLKPGAPLVLVDLCARWLAPSAALQRRSRARTPRRLEQLLAQADLPSVRWERVYDLGPLRLVQSAIAHR